MSIENMCDCSDKPVFPLYCYTYNLVTKSHTISNGDEMAESTERNANQRRTGKQSSFLALCTLQKVQTKRKKKRKKKTGRMR